MSERDRIVSEVEVLDDGEVVTYERLSVVLGREFLDDRQPVYTASRELERRKGRTLINVPKVGYRVSHPGEHVGVAEGRKRRAGRQVRRGIGTLRHTRLEELTPEERTQRQGVMDRLTAMEQGMRVVEARQDRLEAVTESLRERVITPEEVARIAAREVQRVMREAAAS